MDTSLIFFIFVAIAAATILYDGKSSAAERRVDCSEAWKI